MAFGILVLYLNWSFYFLFFYFLELHHSIPKKYIYLLKITKKKNRPWWLSSLEHVSNSNRHSLEDPGSNPAQGENYIWSHLYGRSNAPAINTHYIILPIGVWLARAEPLIEEGSQSCMVSIMPWLSPNPVKGCATLQSNMHSYSLLYTSGKAEAI